MFLYAFVFMFIAISPATNAAVVSSAVRNRASISTCRNLTKATVSHERYKRQSPCGLYHWRCTDGTCIVDDRKCDGKIDCPDRSDETNALCRNIKPTQSGKCVLPPYPEHGTYEEINHPSANPGQSLEYAQLNITCEQGYGVVGDVVPYCLDGTWFIPIQNCVPLCRLDRDVSVHYYCQIPETKDYRLCDQTEPWGTLVKPKCNTPVYRSTDVLLSMTCQRDGKWNRIIKCKPDCGRVIPDAEGLISGGTEAIRGELPWHVAIYEKPTQRRKSYKQICGGSLVSNRIVISAAHCFGDKGKNEKPPASKYAVATAKLFRDWDHKDDKDAQKSELKSIELSPYYQGVRTNFQHDIAVLILETPFVYYIYVRPVCLDFDNDFNMRQLQLGNFGKVAGWGLTEGNGPASPVLKTVKLPFVPIQECIRITPQTFTESITGDKICAGYNNGTAAVCKGDSGGGLSFPETENDITRYYLRGVVSTAPRVSQDCNVFSVTTFTEIFQHKNFLNQFVSMKCTLPPYPDHGIYEVVGDPAAKPGDDAEKVYLNVSCNHDHIVIGNNVVQCNLGEWSTTVPECVPICYLQEHPSVAYSCKQPGAEGFGPCGEYEPVGTSVKPECSLGYYSPVAMPRMRCVGGTWDYVAQCTPECGRLSDNATTLPWYVNINQEYTDSTQKNSVQYQHICGGTIISPNIVMSAANCFWNYQEKTLKAIRPSGSHKAIIINGNFVVTKNYLGAISDEVILPVQDVKFTERFRLGQVTNYQDDIALVILIQAITYSMKLHPVCLDFDYSFNQKQLQEGNLGTVGVVPYSDEVSTEQSLAQVHRIPYIPLQKCLGITPADLLPVTADKICAGQNNGTFICHGSAGSGLAFPENRGGVVRYYLRGVVSLSLRLLSNCDLGYIALTEVFTYMDFIKEQLATSLPPRVMGWQEVEDAL